MKWPMKDNRRMERKLKTKTWKKERSNRKDGRWGIYVLRKDEEMEGNYKS